MKRILFILITIAVLIACQKEISGFLTQTQTSSSLQQFFKKNEASLQTFTAKSNSSTSFTTSKGVQISFAQNSFVTLNNQPVTGDVSIEVKEILTPGDMILNGLPTQSNGSVLESGGEFFVKATQNGQTLKLASGKTIQMQVPKLQAGTPTGMQVFRADTSGGTVNWVPNTTPQNSVATDSFGYFLLRSDSLSWLNIDKFANDPKINYTVTSGNTPNFDSTTVFIFLNSKNSVFALPRAGNKFYSDKIIAGSATIIGFCAINGKYYFSMTAVTLQDGGSTALNLSESSEAEMKQKLATLK